MRLFKQGLKAPGATRKNNIVLNHDTFKIEMQKHLAEQETLTGASKGSLFTQCLFETKIHHIYIYIYIYIGKRCE